MSLIGSYKTIRCDPLIVPVHYSASSGERQRELKIPRFDSRWYFSLRFYRFSIDFIESKQDGVSHGTVHEENELLLSTGGEFLGGRSEESIHEYPARLVRKCSVPNYETVREH